MRTTRNLPQHQLHPRDRKMNLLWLFGALALALTAGAILIVVFVAVVGSLMRSGDFEVPCEDVPDE